MFDFSQDLYRLTGVLGDRNPPARKLRDELPAALAAVLAVMPGAPTPETYARTRQAESLTGKRIASRQLLVLHISDLHRGQPGDAGRWATAREILLADVELMHGRLGAPDLLLFSGDLAYSGQDAEYGKVDQTIAEIRRACGGDPILVAVPGNHDLTRPKPSDPGALAFVGYFGAGAGGAAGPELTIRRDLLKGQATALQFVDALFAGYRSWWERTVERDWTRRGLWYRPGLLPGDFVLSLELGGIRLGIAGMNSAFLHFHDTADHALAIESEQLARCFAAEHDLDLPRWCARHEVNFLTMHHPPDWFAPTARRIFETEVYVPRRFAATLVGHMHRNVFAGSYGSSSLPRLVLQASSLFGLERWGTEREEREIGYAWMRVWTGETSFHIDRWPRKALRTDDGILRLIDDPGVPVQPHTIDLHGGAPAPTRGAAPRPPGQSRIGVLRLFADLSPPGPQGLVIPLLEARENLEKGVTPFLRVEIDGERDALAALSELDGSSALDNGQRAMRLDLCHRAAEYERQRLQVERAVTLLLTRKCFQSGWPLRNPKNLIACVERFLERMASRDDPEAKQAFDLTQRAPPRWSTHVHLTAVETEALLRRAGANELRLLTGAHPLSDFPEAVLAGKVLPAILHEWCRNDAPCWWCSETA